MVHQKELTHDNEEDSENRKSHELNWLASPSVDEQEGHPVSGNDTSNDQDHVADSDVVEVLVNSSGTLQRLVGRTETNDLKDDGGVQSQAVECNLESPPSVRPGNVTFV